MADLLNVCRFLAGSAGLDDFADGAAETGFLNLEDAGAQDGHTYPYRAENATRTEWEIGYAACVGDSSGPVLVRGTPVNGSDGPGVKVNFGTNPTVIITPLRADLVETFRVIRVQTFPASGTYTPDPNMIYCEMMAQGGGAAGGGIANSSAAVSCSAPAGGAGSRSIKFASKADIGASQPVTIGAGGTPGSAGDNPGGNGGDTSVGSLCIGKGATGGGGATTLISGSLGAGGIVGTGDISFPGESGSVPGGGTSATTYPQPSRGGSTPYGSGGQTMPVAAGVSGPGADGTGYGTGGGGAISNGSTTPRAGGAGKSGLVTIREYCSA